MDVLRSCYTTDMQFDTAGEIIAPVQWYWCKPGAKLFPNRNSFSSDIWTEVNYSTTGLGELWTSIPEWRNGSLPFIPPGDGHVCGDISWFSDGCPSDAPPLPRSVFGIAGCCSDGGLIIGGDYKIRYGGGLLLSGDYTYVPPVIHCQPWNSASATISTVLRVSTGTYWNFFSYSGGLLVFTDPLLPITISAMELASAGGSCYGGQPNTAWSWISNGTTAYAMQFRSYDLATRTGIWQMQGTAPHYPNEFFQFYMP